MRAFVPSFLLLQIIVLPGCNKPERALKNESSAPSAQAPKPAGPPPAGMVLIPAGSFLMGENDEARPHDGPIHKVSLNAFYMDETEVTNQQFQAFVDATRYQTMAERQPSAADFPGADPALLKPGANHITGTTEPVQTFTGEAEFQWWEYKVGANWKHPEGSGSSVADKPNLPVVW